MQSSISDLFLLVLVWIPTCGNKKSVKREKCEDIFTDSPHYLSPSPLDTFSKKADETLDFLISCSDTEFINGVTYAELDKLLKTILSPPPLPVFGGGEAVDAPTAPVAASDAVAAATAAVLEDSSVMSTTDSVVAPTSTITNTVAAATTTVFTTTNEAVHHSSEHFGGGNFAPQEVRFGSFGSINFINPVVEEIVHQGKK